MKSLKLKESLYWVGSLDPELRVFDIIMNTDFGTSYNSYCIKGRDRTVLIETVKLKFFNDYIERLKEITDIQKIEYIIVNHTEPDHAGSIEKMLDLNPNITMIGSKTAIDFLKNICNREFKYIEVKNGDGLSLGDKTLKFIDAKCLHWPDTIYTYLVEDKVLFSCDSFGAHYCLDTILQSTIKNKEEYMSAFKYYYDMILSPYKSFYLEAIARIEGLEIDMVCPGHGPVLDEDPWKIIKLSKEYSMEINPNKNKTVVIPYVSAYGYTGEIAQGIKRAIEDAGVDVKIFDMVYADKSEVLKEIYWANGILFGSPTILGEALKPIWDILTDISSVTHRGKLASAFGSYGWSGEAVPNLMERIKQIKMKPFKEGLKIRFKPSDEQLKEAYEFGKEFAEAVKASK